MVTISIERRAHRKGDGRYVRRSVSLPPDVADRIDEEAGDRGFSSFMTEAADRELRFRALGQWLAEYQDKHGEFTEEELAEAMAEWRDA